MMKRKRTKTGEAGKKVKATSVLQVATGRAGRSTRIWKDGGVAHKEGDRR